MNRHAWTTLLTIAITVTLLAGCGGEQSPQQAPGGTTGGQPSAPDGAAVAAAHATAVAAVMAEGSESAAAETAVAVAVATEAAFNDQNPAGGQGTASSQGGIDLSKLDPCALLTEAEVEAVLGPVEWNPMADDPLENDGGRRCTFFIPGLFLVVNPPDDWELEKALHRSVSQTPVSGVGDEGFIFPMGQTMMTYLRGRGVVKLTYTKFDTPYNPDHAKALMLKAIEKLP